MSFLIERGMLLFDGQDAFRMLALARPTLAQLKRNGTVVDDETLRLLCHLEVAAGHREDVVREEVRSRNFGTSDPSESFTMEIDIKETAEMLDVSQRYARRLAAKGAYSGRKVGNQWSMDRGSVVDFAAQRNSA